MAAGEKVRELTKSQAKMVSIDQVGSTPARMLCRTMIVLPTAAAATSGRHGIRTARKSTSTSMRISAR